MFGVTTVARLRRAVPRIGCLGRSAAGAGNADLRSAQPAAGGRNCVQLSCGVSPTSTTALVEVRVAVRTIPLFDVRPVRCAPRSVADRRSAFPDRRRYAGSSAYPSHLHFRSNRPEVGVPAPGRHHTEVGVPVPGGPRDRIPHRTTPPPPSFPIRNYCAEETASPNTLSHADADAPRTSNRMRPHPRNHPSHTPRRPLQSSPAAGAWLSLAEHLVRDQGVAGSNPAAPTRPVLPDGFPAPRRPRHPVPSDVPFPPRPSEGRGACFSALTHGSKRVYSCALAGHGSSRRAPLFLLLLLDIPKSDVMELARMFAPSTSARSAVGPCSRVASAGVLPLDPVAHILSARLAGAGTQR